jgi:hypothetical protein
MLTRRWHLPRGRLRLAGSRLGAVAARVAPLLLVLLADLLLVSFWPPLTTALPALLAR